MRLLRWWDDHRRDLAYERSVWMRSVGRDAAYAGADVWACPFDDIDDRLDWAWGHWCLTAERIWPIEPPTVSLLNDCRFVVPDRLRRLALTAWAGRVASHWGWLARFAALRAVEVADRRRPHSIAEQPWMADVAPCPHALYWAIRAVKAGVLM